MKAFRGDSWVHPLTIIIGFLPFGNCTHLQFVQVRCCCGVSGKMKCLSGMLSWRAETGRSGPVIISVQMPLLFLTRESYWWGQRRTKWSCMKNHRQQVFQSSRPNSWRNDWKDMKSLVRVPYSLSALIPILSHHLSLFPQNCWPAIHPGILWWLWP